MYPADLVELFAAITDLIAATLFTGSFRLRLLMPEGVFQYASELG